ncbi:MAG: hypothetical protein RR444_05480 [Oscillospiraceae bacterium]
MKTDREFLDGVYQKARLLEDNLPPTLKITRVSISKKSLVAAAIFFLLAIPSVYYYNQPKMEAPAGFKSNMPMAIRGFMLFNIESLTANSELILTAKVTKIDKSVYDKDKSSIITNVKVKPTEVLKGLTDTNLLDIKINGGYDKKSKTFVEYEATFKRTEDVLLFLNKDPNSDSYFLSGSSQGKYTYLSTENDVKNYIGPDDITFNTSELKKEILQGE